jgi:hypothetical protein
MFGGKKKKKECLLLQKRTEPVILYIIPQSISSFESSGINIHASNPSPKV